MISFRAPAPRLGEAPTNVSRSSLGALERAKCQITAPVCPEIAPGGAYRAHVRDAVFDVTARSAAAGDAADCGGEFWFPWDTAGLIEASEVPTAGADDGSITTRRFAHDDRRRGLQPASAYTSATMRGWDTMAPRRVGIIPGGILAAHGFQRRIMPLQLSHA
jgi:hypothetical protein